MSYTRLHACQCSSDTAERTTSLFSPMIALMLLSVVYALIIEGYIDRAVLDIQTCLFMLVLGI